VTERQCVISTRICSSGSMNRREFLRGELARAMLTSCG
jgi:hypothetical protein